MSRFELDDLIGAFKGQAIGQEALDLALLQKQLAASLRPASSGMAYPAFSASSNAGPSTSRCTTPTSSAPYYAPSYASSSYPPYGAQAGASTPVGMRSRSRSASRTRAMSMDESNDWDEMQEVEEELVSHMEGTSSYMGEEASSYGYYPAQMEYGTYQQQQQGQRYHAPRSSFPASASASIPPAPQSQSSSFASSDPFYLATLAQSQPAPPSAFSAPSSSFSSASPYPAQQAAGNGGGGNWFAPPVGFAAYAPSSTGSGSGNGSSTTSRWTAHRSATAAAAV